MNGKLIIFSAPSGSGKSTIINYLLQQNLNLAFSISATSRAPRGNEQNGVEYFFLTPEEFKQRIAQGEFLEYEEVYPNRFYGTLKSQVEKQLAAGQNVIFDVDVVGGCNIKNSMENGLFPYLSNPFSRRTPQTSERTRYGCTRSYRKPCGKAEFELGFAKQFDVVIVNDNLETAEAEALQVIRNFINQ